MSGTELFGQPEMLDVQEAAHQSGLTCFLDQPRLCGSDCMAYLNPPPQGDEYRGQQWSNCMLLVNIHRGGKHLVILANVLNKGVDRLAKTTPAVPLPDPPGTR